MKELIQYVEEELEDYRSDLKHLQTESPPKETRITFVQGYIAGLLHVKEQIKSILYEREAAAGQE